MAKFTYTTRKDGRLMKRVSVNGKVVTLYANNPADLEKKYIEAKYSNLKGISISSSSFKAYSEKWLKINSSGKAPATIKEYNYIFNKYLIPKFGYTELKNIKRMDLQELQTELIDKGHSEVAHKCVLYTNAVLNDAVVNDYLVKNPCLGIKEPKLIHKEKEILTEEQDKALLESEHEYAPFFRILRYTGMRREEITAITLKDVDLENKTISINKAVSFHKNQPELKSTKNKEIRTIPILDIIYDDVKKQVEFCKENNIKYLFTQPLHIESMLSQVSIRCMNKTFCKAIGFDFTPHQLRHSYCTMLSYSGLTIKEAQKLMGHKSADMVLRVYTHCNNNLDTISNQLNQHIVSKSVS